MLYLPPVVIKDTVEMLSWLLPWRRLVRLVKFLFICHLIALAFALCGLLLVTSHAEFWGSDPTRIAVWQVLLRVVGSLQIVFGAATMFFFGLLVVGPRKTQIGRASCRER